MLDEFTDQQRQIFGYHNGEKKVFGDPLRLRRRLIQTLGDPAVLVAKVNRISAAVGDIPAVIEGVSATDALIAGAREVFGMLPFDADTGKGATDAMVLGVLNAFFRTCGSSRTAAASQPTSWPSTASTSDSTMPASPATLATTPAS